MRWSLLLVVLGTAGCGDAVAIDDLPDAAQAPAPDARAATPDAAPPDAAAPVGCGTLLAPTGYIGGIATDATHVYWAERSGFKTRLMKIAKQGGAAIPLATIDDDVDELVVQGGDLYLRLDWDKGISRLAAGSSTLEPLASGEIGAFAVDATSVYWIPKLGGREIERVSRFGGEAEVFRAEPDYPLYALALDGDYVYYATGYEIRRVPKANGGTRYEYQGLSFRSSRRMAFDAAYVYTLEGDGIRRIPKPAEFTVGSTYADVIERLSDRSFDPPFIAYASSLYAGSGAGSDVIRLPVTGEYAVPVVRDAGLAFAVDGSGIYFHNLADGIRQVSLAGCPTP